MDHFFSLKGSMVFLLVGHRVEDLDGLQKRASVVSAACVNLAPKGGDAESAAFGQHGNHFFPLVRIGIVTFDRIEDGESVVSPESVDFAVELGNS